MNIILIILVLICSLSSCSNRSDTTNSGTDKTNRSTTASTAGFATNSICSLPKQVAPNTPFANIDGGTWAKWGDSDGELDYGCDGKQNSIQLRNDGNNDISVEYGVIGGDQTAHYISAEYMANQFAGLTSDEKKLRLSYVAFCDKLSEKLYGQKLPDKFRKRLLDESAYSTSKKVNLYGEKVGSGYVRLSSLKSSVTIMLGVDFFASEAEYTKYNDS